MNGQSSRHLSESTMEPSSVSTTSKPKNIIERDFKLAHVHFRNRESRKSFELLKVLYGQAFSDFQQDVIDESLFVKIVNLYLTEIALYCDPSNHHNFTFKKKEREKIVSSLAQQNTLEQLVQAYSNDISLVPSKILLNLSLVYYAVGNLSTTSDGFAYVETSNLYQRLQFEPQDLALQQLVEFYVFTVLVERKKFGEAAHVIRSNVYFASSVQDNLDKLDRLKAHQVEAEALAAKKIKDQEKELKRKQAEEKNREKQNKDLRYKSLKSITQLSGQDNSSSSGPIFNRDSNEVSPLSVNSLVQKVLYIGNLSKSFISENSPVLLVAIVLALVATRFIRTRRINLKEKLKDTIAMAFKISYL